MEINNKKVLDCANIVVNYYDIRKSYIEFDDSETGQLIDEVIKSIGVPFNEDEIEKVRKEVYYRCQIKTTEGEIISDDYHHYKWYDALENGSTYYWDRYRKFLLEQQNFGLNVVNTLEKDTLRTLMNFIGDPNSEANFDRRGLIIGDVQSGKTSTYTGLICKAADAGYKVIILLTGTIESLRIQTQERIEEGFVGANIASIEDGATGDFRVGVGKMDSKPITVTPFTSRDNDFVGNKNKILSSIESNKIILFVIKKNTTVLTKLINWLVQINASKDKKIHYPMLLIDDEADNASINTKKEDEDPAKTNKLIRQLLNVFTQSNYVGFTATPFANVFINPTTPEEMEMQDLFPKNFIFCLPTPSNYIGPNKIFGEDAKFANALQYINDAGMYEDEGYSFYCKHRKDWDGDLPLSLIDAIYTFLLANAIRDLRGDKTKHRSMLINLSRFVAVQWIIKDRVEQIFNSIYKEIKYNMTKNPCDYKEGSLLSHLYMIWKAQYSQLEFAWEEISTVLLAAIEPIQIKVVNSGRGSDKLNYKNNEEEGLRIIAIGGLALSRGLTLEGLVISYFFRNTATYDVLMQMGRWFGYRKNYENLFRIWIGEFSASWYTQITHAVDLLKYDMHIMNEMEKTPKTFGIRVLNDSQALGITARNKMRSAIGIIEKESYFGSIVQAPYTFDNPQVNRANLDLVIELFNDAKNSNTAISRQSWNANRLVIKDLDKAFVFKFLSKYAMHRANRTFNISDLYNNLLKCDSNKIDKWDVGFVEGASEEVFNLDDERLKPVKRIFKHYPQDGRLSISLNGQLTGPADAKLGLTEPEISNIEEDFKNSFKKDNDGVPFSDKKTIPAKEYFKYSKDRNPILLIYLIDLKTDNKDGDDFKNKFNKEPIVSIAIGLPYSDDNYSAIHSFSVNQIYVSDIDEQEEEI